MDELFHAFGIDWKLLLAQAVNFGIVLIALSYFLYKPVIKTLDERRRVVAKGVEDAKEAEEKLAGADTVVAERLSTAHAEAEAVVAHARAAATTERTAIVSEAQSRAQSVLEEAKARAAEEAAKALRESEREIARLAILAAEKVMREKTS